MGVGGGPDSAGGRSTAESSREGLEPGSVFAEDYQVTRKLYTGGLSTIYQVSELKTGVQRALKVVHQELGRDDAVREAFLREAREAAKIQSEHVAEVVASGVDPELGLPFVAMELLIGKRLAQHVEEHGPMAPAELSLFMTQLCHALAAAHAVGVVHRDLKPEGIILADHPSGGAPYRVEVQFVGVGKIASEIRHNTTAAMSRSLWMAPEQTETDARVTPATDVWTLGLLGFWLLTGKHYWKSARDMGSAMMSLLREIMFEPLVVASKRAAELGVDGLVPPGFDRWFARCVARDRDKRYADAADALRALTPVLQAAGASGPGADVAVPSVRTPASVRANERAAAEALRAPAAEADATPPLSRRSRRRRWVRALGALLVTALIGAAGWFGVLAWKERQRREARELGAQEEAAREKEREAKREAERLRKKALAEWSDESSPVPVSFRDPMWGDRTAPVTIVMFSSFACEPCKKLDAELARLRTRHGPDKLRIVWKHKPAPGERARPAALVGQAVFQLDGSAAFFDFAAKAFSARELLDPELQTLAYQAGVKQTADLEKVMSDPQTAQKLDADLALAKTLGVRAVPALFINGTRVPALDEKLELAVKEQLLKAAAELDKGTKKDAVYVALSKAQFVAPAAPVAKKTSDDTVYKVPIGSSPASGAADALVTIVQFAGYPCEECAKLKTTLEQLALKPHVRFVWKDRPLAAKNPRARAAVHFTREVRAQKDDATFFKAQRLIFDNPTKLEDVDFKAHAGKLKLKPGPLLAAVSKSKYDPAIAEDEALASKLAVSVEPTFFVNGVRLSGTDGDKLDKLVEKELAKAQERVAKGTAPSALYDELMKTALEDGLGLRTVDAGIVPTWSPWRGSDSPRVTIQQFADLECPFSKAVEPALAQLLSKYGDRIKIVWRHLPGDDHPHAATLAAAGQEMKAQLGDASFHDFMREAYARQEKPDAFVGENLVQLAFQTSLSSPSTLRMGALNDAIAGKTHGDELLADALKAEELGISETPTFVIGKYLISGPRSVEELTLVLERALKEAP